MIRPATYYEVICDRCGEHLENDGIGAWCDQEGAKDALTYYDWHIDRDGRTLCDECRMKEP